MVLGNEFKKNQKKSFTLKTNKRQEEMKKKNEEDTVEEIIVEMNEQEKQEDERLKIIGIDTLVAKNYQKNIFYNGKLTKGFIRWYIANTTDELHNINILELKEEFDDEKIIGMVEHKRGVLEGLAKKIEIIKVKDPSNSDEAIESLEKPKSYNTKGKCIECHRLTIINEETEMCVICDDVVELQDYINGVYEELTMTNEQIARLIKKESGKDSNDLKSEVRQKIEFMELCEYSGSAEAKKKTALILVAEYFDIDLLDDKWYAFPENKSKTKSKKDQDNEKEIEEAEISKDNPFVNILGGTYEKLSECHAAFLYVFMSNKMEIDPKALLTDTEMQIIAQIEEDLLNKKLIAKSKNNTLVLL